MLYNSEQCRNGTTQTRPQSCPVRQVDNPEFNERSFPYLVLY
jgi:hypothetical protein